MSALGHKLRIAGLGLLLAFSSGAASAETALELKVKAAFLYNFARFVTWPDDKFTAADSPLRICVLDPDPFGAALDDTLRGKFAGSHPLSVLRTARIEDMKACHILYTGNRDAAEAEAALARIAGNRVLTVHEAGRALRSGVARFVLDDRKIRFEINTAAAEREQLQLNPTLARLALTVRE